MTRIKKVKLTIACDSTNNTVPTTPPTVVLDGFLRAVKIKTPAAVDNTATVSVAVADSDGDSIYSKTGVAVNTTNIDTLTAANVPISYPLADTYTITPTFSANQTTARNVIVTLLVESLI